MSAVLTGPTAASDLRGHRVDISWVVSGLGDRPSFRLVRRRRAYPAGPDDGYAVLDTSELFRTPDEPWERVSRLRYLAAGSSAEAGLVQATLVFFHADPGDSEPVALEVAVYDPALAALAVARVDDVTAAVLTAPPPGPWGSVEQLAVTHAPGGGADTPAGVVTVFRDHSDGTTPSRFRWEPAGGPVAEIDFDSAELFRTRADVKTATDRELLAVWPRSRRTEPELAAALSDPEGAAAEDDALITLHERFGEDSGDWTRTLEVADLGATVEETSYYTLFTADPGSPGAWTSERAWTARATPTERYDFPERLYGLLPSMHRYYDEPAPEDRDRGQLRRFLQIFGVGLDHLLSSGESLRTRHDLMEAREDFLPALAGWIAWSPDRSAPLPVQRSEIRLAPDVYETVGTIPNVVALATRLTGWKCEAKEFVHNLFMTNAPEAFPIRELWQLTHDGTGFHDPLRLTTTDEFDGRPAVVVDAGGETSLFWHSSRSGRWELWTRRLGPGGDTDPAPLEEPVEDEPAPAYSDLSPAAIRFPAPGGDLWLFWESDREGAWDVWGRTYDGASWTRPFRITDHAAADRRPGAALGPGGTLWVFWESERRGAPEVWSRAYDGSDWSPAVRITEGLGRDHDPAAALDAGGRLWLVWRRDAGERSRLYSRVLEAGAWGEQSPLEDGHWRDESPALVRRGSELWLLWSSDRTGRWELWGRVHDGSDWGEPFQITMRPDPDKEPALALDGTDLRVFWRSERLANDRRSRTVDTTDIELLERRGLFTDRLHYTYDTAREDIDWYARDAVGLYLTPPPGTSDEVVGDVLARTAAYLEPFCPATVRLVLIPVREAESVDFFSDGIDVDDPIVDEFEDEIE